MIELKNVNKYYNNNGNVTIGLRNINLSFKKGEIVAITGESGAGKSTLLNVICAVDTYEEGELYFNGESTSYFNQQDMDLFRKKHVAFIYQQYNIIDSYTVLENVMTPFLINGYSYNAAKEKSIEIIKKVGLIERVNNKGIQLSGGEKQRCVIARALASDCEILACDEPTGNLDAATGEQIINLIKEVAKDKLVLIVTHNYEQVKDIVTRTISVSDGEIAYDIKNKEIELIDSEIKEREIVQTPKKTLAIFAYKNLKNTPKKTIFAFSLMIIISFVFLFLILSFLSYNDDRKYTNNQFYENTMHNRVVVYRRDHKPIDMNDFSDIEGVIYQNPFYFDTLLKTQYMFNGKNNIYSIISPIEPKEYTLLGGRDVLYENDALLIFPIDMLDDKAYKIGEALNSGENLSLYFDQFSNYILDVCGYASSPEISEITVIYKGDMNEIQSFITRSNMKVNYKINGEVKELTHQYLPIEKPQIYATGLEAPDIESIIYSVNSIYDYEITDYELHYIKSEQETISAYLPMKVDIPQAYELSIFVDDVEELKDTLIKMGYEVVLPGRNGALNDTTDLLSLGFMILICFATSLIFIFIIYIIYLRIYSTKKIDFTILRSLGLIKRLMARIVNYEVVFVGLISSIIAYIVFYILYAANIKVFEIMRFNNVFVTIIYFFTILLLSYFISQRFNKKLFKFSVSMSFKGDEILND